MPRREKEVKVVKGRKLVKYAGTTNWVEEK